MTTEKLRRNLLVALKTVPAILIVLVLFLLGNPNPPATPATPATISNEFLEVSYAGDAVNVYFKQDQDKQSLLNWPFWATWLVYDGKTKKAVGPTGKGWFDDSDATRVEIEEANGKSILKVSWNNPDKDPESIEYIFELDKDANLLSIYLQIRVKNPQRLEYVKYGASYPPQRYETYTARGRYATSGDETTFDIYPQQEDPDKRIPPLAKEDSLSLIDSENDLTLDLDLDSIDRVHSDLENQISSFYISEYAEKDGVISFAPLDFTFYAEAEVSAIQEPSQFEAVLDDNGANTVINVYYNEANVVTLRLRGSMVAYDEIINRIIRPGGEGAWFDENDKREAAIEETSQSYLMSISLSKEAEDVTRIVYALELFKGNHCIRAQILVTTPHPAQLESGTYCLSIPNYDVYLPDGTILTDDDKTFYSVKLTDNYLVLHDGKSLAIVIADELARAIIAFSPQTLRLTIEEHEEGAFAPIYLLYVPEGRVTVQNGELLMETSDYHGTVKEYIESEIYE